MSTKNRPWKTAPISPTCEVHNGNSPAMEQCGRPTEFAYPALGEGWMALCEEHAEKHTHCSHIVFLINQGETFA